VTKLVSTNPNSWAVRVAVAAILAAGAGTHSAIAQEAAAADAAPQEEVVLEEATITGSRIVRRDAEANSPIVTVGAELLGQSSSASLEVNLNKLPQFTPTETPTTEGGDIQPTATNTPGAATISLRGIGTNRNIVLLDGRRATPGNASMVVDINTIPSAAIERVEIISGGASSTYGADAVGGVVNFIMKRNFEGLEIDGQYGITEQGDAEEYTLSGIMGANFADGRGNVMLSFSTQNRENALRRDRKYFRDFYRDPNTAGSEFFPDFPAFSAIGTNYPSQAALNTIFSGRSVANFPVSDRLYFNPDGTAFTGFTASSAAGAYRFDGQDDLKWKTTSNGVLAQNWLDDQLVFPIDRSNMFTRGTFHINDSISVFAQGMFNKSTSHTLQQPAPAGNGWSANIPVDGRALPAELNTILASRANPTGDWQLFQYLDFVGNRESRTDVYTYNFLVGAQGDITGTSWTWEVYSSDGESETNSFQTGFASLERYRTIVTAPNWGAGFSATGNASQGGFAGATANCTSGLNPFMSKDLISADCIEAIAADVKARSTMKQKVYEANIQGAVVNLPAGEVRTALGATYRENNYEFLNDTLTTQGRSFLDQSIGLYPSGNSIGSIDVKEFYGELLVPVLKGLPFMRKLDLELGARTSDYNTTGSSFTWKALADWQVNDWVRLRGGFNRAERAPNIGELFLAPQQTFGFSAGGDVCSRNNSQAWSANPNAAGNSAANAASVEALCRTLMNRSGDTQTAFNFYDGPNGAQNQAAGGGFVFPTTQGNPDLTPEVAKTWTAGAVLSSPFDSPALANLRLIVDYYSIAVDNAIGVQSYDIAQRQCFDVAFNPTLDPNTLSCLNIQRNVSVGSLGNVSGTYVNNGRFRTSGIDTQLSWSTRVGPGQLSASSAANYLLHMKSAALPVTPLVEYAGTLGGTENGLNGSFYRWKMFNTVGYGIASVNVTLQWQHLPKVKSATYPLNNATTISGAPAYDLFNLVGTYALTTSAMLRFGVDNLFNKAPPLTEVNSNPPVGTLAGGGLGLGNYDGLGRRFFVGAKVSF
jgi:outer membrane receptor protein involved in Fe transport